MVFVLTFFSLAACLVIFAYWACQRHMCTQNTWFNLQRVFPMDDITSAQRCFPHAMDWPPLTHQQSQYGPAVISNQLETRLIYWEYLHLLLITWCHAWLIHPSSNTCGTWHRPKYNFMLWFSYILLSDIHNSYEHLLLRMAFILEVTFFFSFLFFFFFSVIDTNYISNFMSKTL